MTLAPVLSAAVVTLALARAAAAPVDYNRDVRPILAENCFSCHGFDEKGRKAKLRLDLADTAHAAGADAEGQLSARRSARAGTRHRRAHRSGDRAGHPPRGHPRSHALARP